MNPTQPLFGENGDVIAEVASAPTFEARLAVLRRYLPPGHPNLVAVEALLGQAAELGQAIEQIAAGIQRLVAVAKALSIDPNPFLAEALIQAERHQP